MQGIKVQLRPSMKKFEKGQLELGIIRCATYSIAFLNRQIIMLLSCLGVEDAVFHNLLDNAITRLDTEKIVNNLKRDINAQKDDEDRHDIVREFELHFGPSMAFKNIFINALYYETIHEESTRKKRKENPFPFKMSKEPIFG